MPHQERLSNHSSTVQIPVHTPRARCNFITLFVTPFFIAMITTVAVVVVVFLLKNYEIDYGEMNEHLSSENSLGPSQRNTELESRQPSFFPRILSPSMGSSSPTKKVPLLGLPSSIIMSNSPSSEIKSNSALQSTKPSSMVSNPASARPSIVVTAHPESSPSLQPSENFTKVPSDVPSREERGGERHHPELKFYVLGDIPYNRREQRVFKSQLQDIQNLITNNKDNSRFIVHVGDLMSAHFSKCREERYNTISTIMKTTTGIPVLTTPGDNEWNRCPDVLSAMANYTKYFIGMENSWHEGRNSLSTIVNRSTSRPENWVFYHSDVLFLAINMVNTFHSNNHFESTNERLKDNLKWFKESCDKYCAYARAIVFFGHSIAGANTFFGHIHERLSHMNIPIMYFTGNGHDYFVKRGVGNGEIPGDFFWRIQVDSGMKAPPIQVTIRGNDEVSMVNDDFHNLGEYQVILGTMVKIDRRGGPYFNST